VPASPRPIRKFAATAANISPPVVVQIDLTAVVDAVLERLGPQFSNGAKDAEPRPRAYRVAEAARELSLSERTCWELISSGELPSITVGRVRLVPSSAIDDWLLHKLQGQQSAASQRQIKAE
jgi:excisionase family DNA binding protein